MAALDTKGYSGKHMNRAMLVTTNDASRPEFRLEMVGDVTPRAYISSDTVRLTGSAGQKISRTVSISPSLENTFTINEINAEKGENIRFTLTEIKAPDAKKYQLTVYNTKKKKGWYIDKIHIHTDSQISPEFIITVFGVIRDGL